MPERRRLGPLTAELEARGLLRTHLAGGVASGSLEIGGVAHDSRAVRGGDLFVAVPGERADGHEFVPAAVAAGAVAVIAERAVPGISVPQLLVTAARPALALAAAWFHGFPSRTLGIVGVTGTDGKTTTCYLVRAMLEACGIRCGLLGTVDVIVGGAALGNPGRVSTPEAPELQGHLAAMVAAGDRFAVVESTSHGLAMERVAEVAYDVAVLTNVTQEHLDFHRTPEAYRAAKRRLFERLRIDAANPDKGWRKTAVVNADDLWASEFLAAAQEAGAGVVTYGSADDADVRLLGLEEGPRRLVVALSTPRWKGRLQLHLAGRFNAHNALAAVAVGEALGLDPGGIREGLERLEGVPGRMERIEMGQPFAVVVDYAHTAEALEKVLDDLRPVAAARAGRVITVFGSAGERDVVKRPLMGRVAGERAELVIVTDEDPRGEDREQILEQIARGAEDVGKRRGHDLLLVADRRQAIETALEQARTGDVVVLAGKGHERTIEMADGPRPWDEAGTARAALAALGFEPAAAPTRSAGSSGRGPAAPRP